MFGAIISGVASLGGALLSKKSADKASGQAAQASAEQLAFEQARYDDWKAIYGPIQENLSNYYSNISPDYYEAMGLEAFELERTAMMEQLDTVLAQRGLADSGMAAQLEADMGMQAATQRAKIRRQAPVQARQEQQDFLSLGMRADPAPSVSSALGQRTAYAQQYAQQAGVAAGEAMGSAVSTIGSGLSEYLGPKVNQWLGADK